MNTMHPAPLHGSTGVATPNAGRYLQQLCKHFAHARPSVFTEASGEIAFTAGTCRLVADAETLTITLSTADAVQLAELRGVIERHLVRFAFREPLQIDWQA